MPSLLRRYRLLLSLASLAYLIPCSYNNRTRNFECTQWNTFALVRTSLFFGVFIWYDVVVILGLYNTISLVMLGIVAIDVTVYGLLIYCIVLNARYNRTYFVRLLNSLFGEVDWTLEWIAKSVSKIGIHPSTHSGNLLSLAVLVVLYCLYNVLFVYDPSMVILDTIILARFCFMFLVTELYRACAIIIQDRMKQLKMLFRTIYVADNASVEKRLHIFLERFQRYQQLIDSVNHCFSVPLTHILLLILLERTVSVFDMYSNLESNVYRWTFFGFLYRQVWEIVYIVIMVQLALTSHSTIWQVEETALCTRHFDDYRLQNTRAAKQIQKFLLKNLHQKKKFSACGFFDIDNTVIYMVFSSIVTYLVILIQFKQLETDLTQSEGVFNVTSNLTTPGPS
uniref:Gustatory receptor n=1 Tax=Anopheles dirus TaxID=7168 RepID=A0A182NBX6_9DIPT